MHAIVLVSGWNKATQRALAFARAARPDSLTALTVNINDAETRALNRQWESLDISIPLKVVESPYREISRPVLQYMKRLTQSPRDVVCIYIPQTVVGRWWENLLHNQSSLRLKTRLLFEPDVMVTSVPYQLRSASRHGPPATQSPANQIPSGVA